MVELRKETPGKFCVIMCTTLLLIAYIGSYISAFCLFYYLAVGGLVVPGSIKYIIKNHPPAKEAFENLRILEELKCNKKSRKKDIKQDEVDGVASGMNVDIRGAADKVQYLVQNVCSTLQTGVSSITSNLPDLQQVRCCQYFLLKSMLRVRLLYGKYDISLNEIICYHVSSKSNRRS